MEEDSPLIMSHIENIIGSLLCSQNCSEQGEAIQSISFLVIWTMLKERQVEYCAKPYFVSLSRFWTKLTPPWPTALTILKQSGMHVPN